MSVYSKARRIWFTSSAIFAVRANFARWRGLVAAQKPLFMLLTRNRSVYTSEQQFAPLLRSTSRLRKQFGIVIHHVEPRVVLAMSERALSKYALVGIQLSFRVPSKEAEEYVAILHRKVSRGNTRLVYFDGDDDLNIQWPGILKHVHLYVKKHTFANLQDYTKRYIGKSNLTHFLAEHYNVSFEEDPIPTSGGIPISDLGKLHLGWNIALDDKIHQAAQMLARNFAVKRNNDVTCRAYVPPTAWTYWLRATAAERLQVMSGEMKVNAPTVRVSQGDYYKEMLDSKICVSPFGAGEICWRDFEAILCGCLLIKPDMGHIKTEPNIFRPGETYIPCRWDYSDLQDLCLRYIKDDEERLRITRQAREALTEALREQWFLDRFGELLAKLALCGDHRVSPEETSSVREAAEQEAL